MPLYSIRRSTINPNLKATHSNLRKSLCFYKFAFLKYSPFFYQSNGVTIMGDF